MSSRRRSYSFEPVYTFDGGMRTRRHAEARTITNTGYQANLVLPNARTAAKRTEPRAYGVVPLTTSDRVDGYNVPVDWAPWLGRPIASGAYGVTFKVANAGAAGIMLGRIRRTATFYLEDRQPRDGEELILKIARDFDEPRGTRVPLTRVTRFVRDSAKESSWHRALDSAPCVMLPGLSRTACVAAHVPAFYWSGMALDEVTKRRFYVTAMSVAPGVTAKRYLDGAPRRGLAPVGPLTVDMYLAIERVVASMWLRGIVHADFHLGNVLYNPRAKHVTVIDFGQSVGLTPDLQEAVRVTIPKAIAAGVRSLGELWYPPSKSPVGLDLQGYTDRVRYTREKLGRRFWYNPDGHALMQLYRRLTRQQREFVAVARAALWGAPSTPQLQPRLQAKTSMPRPTPKAPKPSAKPSAKLLSRQPSPMSISQVWPSSPSSDEDAAVPMSIDRPRTSLLARAASRLMGRA